MRLTAVTLTIVAILASAVACGSGSDEQAHETASGATAREASGAPRLPQGSEPVGLDPADFTNEIDNPYWPMRPGARWVYRETDAEGAELRVEVTVTGHTREILGIDATVVHDVVTEDGQLKEDTYDWYAQDKWGNVWYMGEDTKEYEGGKVSSTEGSWEAGVDGAQAGIIVPSHPEPGMAYRQEHYEGHAEDRAEVLSVDEQATVPYGSFDHVLMTRDYNLLEPMLLEHKFYAKGLGPVLAMTVAGGADHEELLRFTG
ncbi:MAG: hypothetical protein ACRDOG_05040 [Gaiellaceae bacterium]